MLRKYGWLVVLMIMVLALSACGSSKPAASETPQKPAGKSEPTQATTEKPAAPEKAAGYPDKPIDFIIPYSPGGGTDIMSRTIGKMLTEQDIVKQPFVMTNKPGGGGAVAMTYIDGRKGDPYVLMGVPSLGDAILTGTVDLKYSDFTPIAMVASDTNLIVVPKDSRFKTIQDLIGEIKAKPGQVSAAGTSPSGVERFVWYSVANRIGAEINYIPFNSGGEVTTALLGHQVDVAIANPGEAGEQLEAGNFRALAVTADERLSKFPDVPTLKEVGLDFSWYMARGVWAAGNIPDEDIAYWNDAFKKLTSSNEWKKDYIEKNVLIDDYKDNKDYQQYLTDKGAEFKKFLDDLGLSK